MQIAISSSLPGVTGGITRASATGSYPEGKVPQTANEIPFVDF
jgi:hypothetical protein